MRKAFLLIATLFTAVSIEASSVKQLAAPGRDVAVYELTVDAGDTILTPVVSLRRQGDVVPAEHMVVNATSTAAVAVNVDVHVAADPRDTFFELTDNEVALSGASPQFASSDLDDHEPYVKLEVENAGSAEAVVTVYVALTEEYATVRKRVEQPDREGILRAKAVTLAASTGTDSRTGLLVNEASRLALFFQPSATGLTYTLTGKPLAGGPDLALATAAAIGAVDTRIEVDLSAYRLSTVDLTVDNPTIGQETLTYSAATLP